MEIALEEARLALGRGEVPVGCAIVSPSGVVLATGSNRTNERGNATAHAEMIAFENLSEVEMARPDRGSLTLFVTCEPCIMCASAIVQVGVIGRVLFGCANPRFGGCGSVRGLDIYGGKSGRGFVPSVEGGVCAKECVELLGRFYMRTNPNAPRPKKKRKKAAGIEENETGKEEAKDET